MFSNLGYKKNSPDVNNPFNVINSNRITMKGVDKKLLLIPMGENGTGDPVLAKPGEEYHFPDHSHVLEIPATKQIMNQYKKLKQGGSPNLISDNMKRLKGNYQTGGTNTSYPKGFDPTLLSHYLPSGQQPLSTDQLYALGYTKDAGSSQFLTPSGDYRAYKTIPQGTPEWNNPNNPYYTPDVSAPKAKRTTPPPTQPPATFPVEPVMNNLNNNPSDITSDSYIGQIKPYTNPPTVPKSQRRGVQNLGINIHKPGANKYGFNYGGSTNNLNIPPVMFNMGGVPCKECGGAMQEGGSTDFNSSNMLDEKKNDFMDWLKNTSLDAVHEEMIPHATFHHMPDGSIMSDAEMTSGMEDMGYMKKGGNWIPKNLKKGRCTPLGKPGCPPGSPQYNLAKTFKKHHGFHKKQDGGINDQFFTPENDGNNIRKFIPQYAQDGTQVTGREMNDKPVCSEEDMHNPFSICYDPRLLNANNMAPIAEMNPYASTTYMGTQSDLNATNQQLHGYQSDLIQGQSNAIAVQAAQFNQQSAAGDMYGPNTTSTPPSSTFKFNQGTMSGEDQANMGILGMEALTNIFNTRDRKTREKQLRDKTHADQVFTSTPGNAGSRGNYDINQGYFRADQMIPTQFTGAAGQYRKYGGSYDQGGEYYLSDTEIQDLKNQGYDVEYLD